jgi:hypothetical protein
MKLASIEGRSSEPLEITWGIGYNSCDKSHGLFKNLAVLLPFKQESIMMNSRL